MKVISMAVAKRQAEAAKSVTKRRADLAKRGVMRSVAARGKDDAEIAQYRRQLRAFIKRTEKRALTGAKDDPERMEAVRTLSAMVLAMYVAEHDLRQDIHRAVDATLAA